MAFRSRKQPSKKECGDELPLLHKNLPQQDTQKMPLFFPYDQNQFRSELQMPIKIQGNSRLSNSLKRRQRINEYAHQSSEHLLANDHCSNSESKHESLSVSKENHKDQYQMLIHGQNKFDPIDSLLMPLYDLNPQHQNQINQYVFEDEGEVKLEANHEENAIFVQKNSDPRSFSESQIIEQRKAVYCLLNSFRAFYQATNICVNTHRLAKKDSLNKVYSSILSVLTKQNKKMFLELDNQRKRVDELFEKTKSLQQKGDEKEKEEIKDELVRTGVQGEGLCLKKKMTENDYGQTKE